MKKTKFFFLTLLAGLLMSVSAGAADTVERGIYRIKNVYNGRGELVYNSSHSYVVLNNITYTGYSGNSKAPTGNGAYWYVRPFKGKLYIYNVEANKFLKNNSDATAFSDEVSEQTAFSYDTQTASSTTYFRIISPTSSSKYLSTSCGWAPNSGNQVKFRTHEAASDYLSFLTDEGEDLTKYATQVAAADAKIDVMIDVTYNYTFGGNVMKSETFEIVAGSARPTASASMVPYACEADYSAVPANIDATATYNVPINTTTAFPFEFAADFASAKWYTWKMANRVGGTASYKGYVWNNGTRYQQTDLEAQPTDAKYLYAFVGTPYGFTIMTADGNYVYSTCKNDADLVTASAGTEFVALASKKSSGWTGYDKYFYFKGANANGSVNEMDKGGGYRKVGYWTGGGYDDNGSLVAIEAVSVKAYKVVFAEGTPETGKVTFSGNDVTPSSTVKAFSSEAAITVADLTVGAVEGYTPNTPVIADNVITVSYTLNKSQAWADLDAKITEAKAITVPTGPWGTNPGHFNQTACEGFPGVLSAAEVVLNDPSSTDTDYNNATATLQAAIDALAMVKHQEGKFYTIKGLNENYPWITEQSAGTKGIRVSANAADAGIFYYTPEHNLLGFQSGDYLCYTGGAYNIKAGENDVIKVTEYAGNGRFYISTYDDSKDIYLHNNNTDQKTHEGTKTVTTYNAYTFTEVTTLPITIGSTGYATFSAPVDVEIPADVTAFIASSYSNPTLTMTSIETGKIPANTGVVLKAAAGTYYFNVTTDAEAVGTNNLKPVIATQDVEATADYTALILASSGSSVAFYPLSSESKTVKGHRAYLELLTAELPTSGEAKVNVLWDDVTGINNVDVDANVDGKFFENGRIVIVKNNAKYNVAGQMVK